jgi:hypothetical protein
MSTEVTDSVFDNLEEMLAANRPKARRAEHGSAKSKSLD